MCMNKLELQYQAITKIAELVNEKFFNNELPKIAITLQGDRVNSSTYGWFWAERWESKNEKIHELNITAENIDNLLQLFITMHHEFIHLYAQINDIQDTSRQGRWHNKNFQKLCEKFELFYVKDKKIGTRTPHSKDEGVSDDYITWVKEQMKVKEIDKWLSSEDVFKRIRPLTNKVKKPKTTQSYECLGCGEKVSLKIELVETLGEWTCPYCQTRMVEE